MTKQSQSMNTLQSLVDTISLGEPHSQDNITIFPIHAKTDSLPVITLNSAMKKGLIKIREISDSGSVPELRVISMSDLPVLLLDGEELAGAKQNRTLNTTILVPEHGDISIPVSCTEQGRWSYNSSEFYDSNEVLSYEIRTSKMNSVSSNLKERKSYESDQSEVWDGIRDMFKHKGLSSRTGAMKDIYTKRRNELDHITEDFPLQENQNGLLVYIGSRPVGLDLVGYTEVYAQYHEKLLRSYIIDSISSMPKGKVRRDNINGRSFINLLGGCIEERFKSPGLGWDHRYEGNGIVGSSLKVENCMIHAAFFSTMNNRGYYRDTGRIKRDSRPL